MTINEKIITFIGKGDERGLSLLYDNYSSTLFGIAYRILQNEAHSEDALQKCFLKVWKNIDQYDAEKSSLYTWMAQIIRNTALDIRRLKSFQKEEKTITINPHVHGSGSDSVDTHSIDTQKLLTGLEDKYKFVLEYLYLKGYTQSELADEFDIPIGTIKTRVRKAIEILQENIKGEKSLFLGLFVLLLIILLVLLF